ncbi:alkaline phosphatase family protein [Flammeovirga aprica]|uniref:Alkaline phosphatase family protein n=1 Tax=Flammeovirga aprica JL-4 TaxID=694437 RepID=A0A7X9XA87_9BACT|nr:ectonucleotide pyrophosphatase/phosphodiesterase [Flammeovirga aprica]NME69415.1 alkaline phosphatase family protein [Flammeovirga aprica JL-4]
MNRYLLLVILPLTFFSCQIHQKEKKPENTVILVSIDGFRYDYSEKYNTPNLNKIAKDGVKAKSMIPAYPSKTFPNHYSIVTGMYPQNNGLVHNNFYDPEREQHYKVGLGKKDGSWFKGTPLWNLAEQQGQKSATFYWPVSDARVEGMTPSYYFKYNKPTPYFERVDQIEKWLALDDDVRPTFIATYFSLVDTQGHLFGPDADETKEAVEYLDQVIGKLYEVVKASAHPIDLIIVSDHGMQQVDVENSIVLESLGRYKDFVCVNGGGIQYFLYPKKGADIEKAYQDLKAQENKGFVVYKKEEVPERLHFSNGQRIPEIICEAIPPMTFRNLRGSVSNGMHGYNPYKVKNMHAVFYAVGDHFQKGKTIESFENIHIYPLVAKILGLKVPDDIDGDVNVLLPTMHN